MFEQIPEEMRAYAQWVCWRYEIEHGDKKATKVPYSISGHLASVTSRNTWAPFYDATKQRFSCVRPVHPDTLCSNSGFSGIGFVLTKNDPFAFIDLDDTREIEDEAQRKIAIERQMNIFSQFGSYSEISPSGSGLHIIVKGNVPAGRKRSKVEVYSSERYMTMTGNVYRSGAIEERQEMLTALWEQMGGTTTANYTGDEPERETDDAIIAHACQAKNADKFKALLAGQWQTIYESQSQADFAFIDILAYFTQNREQIRRIFLSTPLGQRKKAHRIDYVHWMVSKSFDRLLPPVDLEGLKNQLELKLAEKKNAAASSAEPAAAPLQSPAGTLSQEPTEEPLLPYIVKEVNSNHHLENMPPGLLGEIAAFIYASSPRPVGEIALTAAIGLMSGIAGRAYNINGTGLNCYTLLLAGTGSGKEAMSLGISKLMTEVRSVVPNSAEFIGPSTLNSGQALLRRVAKTPCFVSLLPEFDIALRNMSAMNASQPQGMLKQVLLDFYNKSGKNAVLHGSAYADKEKDIPSIASPAFSILAESNPASFYNALNENMISAGLLPRFIIIEYKGKRVPSNKFHAAERPLWSLLEKIVKLCTNALDMAHGHKTIDVQFTPEAEAFLDDLDAFADKQMNDNTDRDVIVQLWNRVHMNALKLSALIAVGCDRNAPVITLEHAEWAQSLIVDSTWNLVKRFEQGEVGASTGESKQLVELIRAIREFLMIDGHGLKYGVSKTLIEAKVIPYAYLSRRLIANSAFKEDRMGATSAINRTIKIMTDADDMREVEKARSAREWNTTQRCFMLQNVALLDGPKPILLTKGRPRAT